jgi:hypothetical protein
LPTMVVHELWGIPPGRYRPRRVSRWSEAEWQLALKHKRSLVERGWEEVRLTTRHIDLDDDDEEDDE